MVCADVCEHVHGVLVLQVGTATARLRNSQIGVPMMGRARSMHDISWGTKEGNALVEKRRARRKELAAFDTAEDVRAAGYCVLVPRESRAPCARQNVSLVHRVLGAAGKGTGKIDITAMMRFAAEAKA